MSAESDCFVMLEQLIEWVQSSDCPKTFDPSFIYAMENEGEHRTRKMDKAITNIYRKFKIEEWWDRKGRWIRPKSPRLEGELRW